MHEVEYITAIAVAVVIIIGLVSNFAQKLGVAAPLLLTIAGIGLSLIPGAPALEVDPHIILGVILPPILYSAALHMPFVDFRRNLVVISALAVVLVVLSALATALVVSFAIPSLGLALAFAVGAVVAPPDAVSAISLARRLGLPKRVVTILEGEGLVNDATALVLLSTSLTIASSAAENPDGFTIALDFVWKVAGAIIVGLVISAIAIWSRSKVHDKVLDIAIALAVPFITFIVAEKIHASGVVAVVMAGIYMGNRGVSKIAALPRRTERENWATFSMLVENGVFLLLGYQLLAVFTAVAHEGSTNTVVLTALAVTATLIAVRFSYVPLVVLDIRRRAKTQLQRHQRISSRFAAATKDLTTTNTKMLRRIEYGRRRIERAQWDVTAERDNQLGWKDATVISLAGMRGVVTIAAAQTLPASHPLYHSLVLLAFLVALFTLIPQGLLLPIVVRAVKLPTDSDTKHNSEFFELLERMSEHAARVIDEQEAAGILSTETAAQLRTKSHSLHSARIERLKTLGKAKQEEQWLQLRHAQISAQHRLLHEERKRGKYSSETIAAAQKMLDAQQIEITDSESTH